VTPRRTVLVTGGAGFIGSHTCVELLQHGNDVVIADNHANSSPFAPSWVERVAGRRLLAVHNVDVTDEAALGEVFQAHPVDAVIHFAARKAVGESIHLPLEYHRTNTGALLSVLGQMRAHGVHRLIFSSSCSIYGAAENLPLTEEVPGIPTNPYAQTKQYAEQVLSDVCDQDADLRVVALRYFNPAGAHHSGQLGEDPRGTPVNLMPYLAQVAVGRLPYLTVFGGDWPTHDGTCIRDYVHVEDVADGHRVALDRVDDEAGLRVFNLGTGIGSSVLELVRAFERACGQDLPVKMVARRPGDVASLVASPAKVAAAWGWHARHDVDRMCRDAWRFQQNHPVGYQPIVAGPSAREVPA
jgi:UDP-glucose 4-epimerase